MALERKDVEHVARLARLELSEEELALYTKQLGDILKYVEKLNQADTADVGPSAHAAGRRLRVMCLVASGGTISVANTRYRPTSCTDSVTATANNA